MTGALETAKDVTFISNLVGEENETANALGDLASTLMNVTNMSQEEIGALIGAASVMAVQAVLNKKSPKIRLRHFTNKSGLEGMKSDQKIVFSDQNTVFNVRAKGKPGSPRDVKEQLGIKRGRGSFMVEYDANVDEVNVVTNPRTGATEYNIKENVDLTGRNPVFKRNR